MSEDMFLLFYDLKLIFLSYFNSYACKRMQQAHGGLHRIVAERFLLAPRNFTDAIHFGMLFPSEKAEILLRKLFLM
jgi:hypothetical protein